MLKDLDRELSQNKDLELETLRRAASTLLSRQFIYRFKGQDRAFFFTIKDSQTYFSDLFHALGHKLIVNDSFGYIGLVPEFNFRQMKLVDTLFLMVARLVYDEEMKSLRGEDDIVAISHESFLSRYEMLTGRERPSNEAKFRNGLSTLQRYGVVKSIDSKQDEPILNIYPGIMSLMSADTTEQIASFNQVDLTDEEEVDL